MNNNDKIDKTIETLEEHICNICEITEKDANSIGIKFIKLSDIYNEKFDKAIGFELSSIPKIKSGHICSKCVETTNLIIEKVLNYKYENRNKNINEFKGDIDSFIDYISSTAHLFKLDHVTVIQSCFSMFISGLKLLSEYDTKLSKTIIKATIIELERELLEIEKRNCNSGT